MKILFIGAVDFSGHCLEILFSMREDVVAVISRQQASWNADHKDLGPLARARGIPCYYCDDINADETLGIIRRHAPDVIFCFGWSQIIKPSILSLPPLGVVGFHPSALPMNRGRHPIIWTLVLGLKTSAVTFFRMDAGADTGDIIAQKVFTVKEKDTAATVYQRIKRLAGIELRKFVPLLKKGGVRWVKQDIRRGNVWRKRGEADGRIDWRMSTRAIVNLVRALTRPYGGADCRYRGQDVKVWQVRSAICTLENMEPGKVLKVGRRGIRVKTYDGAVDIVNHGFKELPREGEYLL